MADQNSQYMAMLTAVGEAKLATPDYRVEIIVVAARA